MKRLRREIPHIIIGFLAIIVTLNFAACGSLTQNNSASSKFILPYKVGGASDQDSLTMMERLSKSGVRVITMGQNYLVSIPSALLFADQSPRLTWGSYAVLNDVACYLKQYRKISLHVSAFSSKCVSPDRERALTLARARNVGNYLRSQNIDGRFIFTHGLGSDKPIMSFEKGGDQSPNSRIEITFRNVVA